MDKRGSSFRAMYEDGSAVRRIYEKPYDYSSQPQRRQPLTEEEFRRLKEQQKGIIKKRKKTKKHITKMEISTLFCLSISALITLYMCISFLMVQSQITSMSKETARLQSELVELQNENNAAYERIETSMDLSKIYKIATEELGMVHASEEQVVTYEDAESDYVRKYAEIPQKKSGNLLGKILNK